MLTPQKTFLRDQALANSIIASLQHTRIYSPQANDSNRNQLNKRLREVLKEIAEGYTMPVSEETHVQNIVRIKDTISKECSTFLINGFRLGVAQKALNLYLKYLWCLGIITPPPPHCPFDRIIIEKLPEEIRVPWTQINDVDTYLRLVEAAKKITAAQKRSLADWELNAYQG